MSTLQADIPTDRIWQFPYVFFEQRILVNGRAEMSCKMCDAVLFNAGSLSKHLENQHRFLRSHFYDKLRQSANDIVDNYLNEQNTCTEHLNHTPSEDEEPSPDFSPVAKKRKMSPSPSSSPPPSPPPSPETGPPMMNSPPNAFYTISPVKKPIEIQAGFLHTVTDEEHVLLNSTLVKAIHKNFKLDSIKNLQNINPIMGAIASSFSYE
ncbi:hypothetical protein DMENIID0001_065290 [Sergentomyia squamirostris]